MSPSSSVVRERASTPPAMSCASCSASNARNRVSGVCALWSTGSPLGLRSPRWPGRPALAAAEVALAILVVAFGTERRVLILNPGLRRDAGGCQTVVAVPSSDQPAVDAGPIQVLLVSGTQHLHVPDLVGLRLIRRSPGHSAGLLWIRCGGKSLEQKAPEKGINVLLQGTLNLALNETT